MLKLERTSREGMISVIVRDKESLFTQPVAFAFGIAFAIHLSLILLFHIAPFNIGMSGIIFPPVRVEADASLKESVVADVESNTPTIRGLPTAPSSGPIPSQHPKFLTVRPIEYSKAENSTANAFTHIEEGIYQPEFHPLARLSKKPLEIVISGTLAEQILLSDGTHQLKGPLDFLP